MAQRHQSAAGHRVFLLTLWQEAADTPWRAALRAADSQQRIGFADLEALALFPRGTNIASRSRVMAPWSPGAVHSTARARCPGA